MGIMSVRQHTGIAVLLLSTTLAGLNLIAFRYFLYWRLRWFDMPMHFLAGVVVASVVLWVLTFEIPPTSNLTRYRFALVFGVTLAVGIAWEVFEYAAGITRGEPGYWFDTLHDLVMDGVGGAALYWLVSVYGKK